MKKVSEIEAFCYDRRMKVYLTHSTSFDYKKKLYTPLKQLGEKYDIYFPHDVENNGQNSKDIIATSDIVLAEVSYPSTGQGIELGWANANGIPIICINQSGVQPSRALNAVSKDFIEYDSAEDLANKVSFILKNKA